MAKTPNLANVKWVERPAPAHYDRDGNEIEEEHDGNRSYRVAEAFFSPKGKKWPVYSYAIVDMHKLTDGELFENRFSASVSFKRAPTSWWTETNGAHGGAPPQILKALAKKLLEVLP
jgi:hypothetical protein